MYRVNIDHNGKIRSGVIRLVDGAHIPADPLNTHWREYLEWIEAGNKPKEPPADALPDTH